VKNKINTFIFSSEVPPILGFATEKPKIVQTERRTKRIPPFFHPKVWKKKRRHLSDASFIQRVPLV